VRSDNSFYLEQLGPRETSPIVQLDRVQPELRDVAITPHVNVRTLFTVS
jgi:hypothetical protein